HRPRAAPGRRRDRAGLVETGRRPRVRARRDAGAPVRARHVSCSRPSSAMLPGAATHEGSTADLATVATVLGEAVSALERAKIDHLLIGGIASAIHGRPRCSSDVDLLIGPGDAPAALEVLARAGFETERTNPHW